MSAQLANQIARLCYDSVYLRSVLVGNHGPVWFSSFFSLLFFRIPAFGYVQLVRVCNPCFALIDDMFCEEPVVLTDTWQMLLAEKWCPVWPYHYHEVRFKDFPPWQKWLTLSRPLTATIRNVAQLCDLTEWNINPLHPDISMDILHVVLRTFPKVLTRRIWLTIKSFFSSGSFPYSPYLIVWFRGDMV